MKLHKFVPTFIRVNISLHMKQPDVYPSWSIMFLSFSQESADAAPSTVDVTGPVLWHWGIIKKNMQCNEHKTCRYICACELSWNIKKYSTCNESPRTSSWTRYRKPTNRCLDLNLAINMFHYDFFFSYLRKRRRSWKGTSRHFDCMFLISYWIFTCFCLVVNV